jgi:hypothetical protein
MKTTQVKKQKKLNKNKAGRKWFDGKTESDVVAKLKVVWGLGGSDAEACYYADISKFSLSRYLDAYPDVEELRNKLKEKPILKARETVVKNLSNPDIAFRYLERKKKDEFGASVELPDIFKNNIEAFHNEMKIYFIGNVGSTNTKRKKRNMLETIESI